MTKKLSFFLTLFLLTIFSCNILPIKATKGDWELNNYFDRAKEYQANQRYKQAISLLLKATEFYNKPMDSIKIFLRIGEYLEKEKEFKKALSYYKNAIEVFNTNEFDDETKEIILTTYITPIKKKIAAMFEKYIIESQLFSNSESYKKALAILNEAVVEFPNTNVIAVNYNIGFIYYKLGKYDLAKSYFNRVMTLYKNSEFNYSNQSDQKKFIVLADKLLKLVEEKKKGNKDPYHIAEDLDKKIKPKKK